MTRCVENLGRAETQLVVMSGSGRLRGRSTIPASICRCLGRDNVSVRCDCRREFGESVLQPLKAS